VAIRADDAGRTFSLARRLSRLRDAFDDGRGVALEPRVEGAARKLVLGLSLTSSITCRMDRLFVARPDPAVVFIYGRGGVAVFVGGADGQRPVAETDDHSRLHQGRHPDLPRHLPAFGQPPYDLFHV